MPIKTKKTLLAWSSPVNITLVLFFPLLFLYVFTPESWMIEHYRSIKIAGASDWPIFYFLSAIAVFGMSAYFGQRNQIIAIRGENSLSKLNVRPPRWFINLGILFSLLGYIIWIGTATTRAGGILNLINGYLNDPFFTKSEIFETIPGITTTTQIIVIIIPLLLAYYKDVIGTTYKFIIWLFVILSFTRSFLVSERLAFLEIVIPTFFILFANKKISLIKIIRYGVLALLIIIIFFIANEARRSFVYTLQDNIFAEGFSRFIGYYLTSINNGMLSIQELSFITPFYNSFQILWKFPGLPDDFYTLFSNITPIPAPELLPLYGLSPEFNVFTTVGYWVMDFGLIGALFVASVFGFFSGALYRAANSSPAALSLYSLCLVGLAEFMRIYYFVNTRLFPGLMFWLVWIFISYNTKKTFKPKLNLPVESR